MRRPTLLLTLLACVLLALPAAASAQVQARITNGDDAGANDYPWTVALVSTYPGWDEPEDGQFCGGSLIAADVVLTAAHCTMGSRADELYVFAGSRDLNDNDPAKRFSVASIHLPTQAEVDPDTQAVPRYDIAILKLDDPVPGAEPIGIVQDGEENSWNDDALEVMGWGLWEQTSDPYPEILQHGTVDRVSDMRCEAVWGDDFDDTDMVCALGSTGPPDNDVVDSCRGDSGGPLTTIGTNAGDPTTGWKLVGAVSFGTFDCLDPEVPGVYARMDQLVLRTFAEEFSDGEDPDDPPAQIEHTGGDPVLSGTLREGEQISCDPGDTTWSVADPVAESSRVRLYDEFTGELITMSVDAPYTLTASDVDYQFLCEVHGKKTGAGGYGVARSGLSGSVAAAPFTPPPPPPIPPAPPPVIITVLPPPPDPQPFVPEPRDEGVPRPSRISRRCQRRQCTLNFFTIDTTTSGAAPVGVKAVQVRLTSRYRCVRGGRRRTCIRRRSFAAAPTLTPGVFRVRTPRLARGLHTVRVTAVDANGNREPRALTYSFRLRR